MYFHNYNYNIIILFVSTVNIAYDKSAYQSSTLYGQSASRAVDGYALSDGNLGSCAVTKTQDRPFLLVDLEKQFVIASVKITSSDIGRYILAIMFHFSNFRWHSS